MGTQTVIAFLIIAHTEPALLRRLVRTLDASWVRFFVHIDKKVEIRPFQDALSDVPNATLIENRVSVYWGGWSQVQATLNLIQEAVDSNEYFHRFALLSGSCYPVKSNVALRDFLLADDSERIDAVRMPNMEIHKPLSRLTKWYFEGGHRVPGLKAWGIQLANIIAALGPTRNLAEGLGDFVPYAGSQWWVVSNAAIRIILRTIHERPNLTALYRNSKIPDESFFQTIIANSSLSSRITESLTFADWSRPQERPCLIDEGHLAMLLDPGTNGSDLFGSPPIFFARKFSSRNADLLDKIDAALRP